MADVHDPQSTIDDYDLELSLAFRPLNSSLSPRHHHPNNLLEQPNNTVIVSPPNNGRVVSKHEGQAIRRHQAKVKMDMKRKVPTLVIRDEEEGDFEKRRKKGTGHEPTLSWGNAGGFRAFQGQNGKFNEGGDAETRSSLSSGSSSGVSDYYLSNSLAGGNSSDTSSHSSHPHLLVTAPNVATARVSQTQTCSFPQETDLNNPNLNVSQPQLYSICSNQTDLLRSSSQSSELLNNIASGNTAPPPSEGPTKDRCSPDKKPVPTRLSPSPKEVKGGVNGKPPKPNGQTSQQKVVLPQMPCVSVTGNGPMGKTITGFLYKYSNTEVSIMCVCHGISFSPAGFVEHAGGVDVEHPLRQIRVVPFALS